MENPVYKQCITSNSFKSYNWQGAEVSEGGYLLRVAYL